MAWLEDLVSFCIGCGFSVDHLLLQQGVKLKYAEKVATIAIFISDLQMEPSQYFSGPLIVSMRYIKHDRLDEVVWLTAEYPVAHGAFLFWGGHMEGV